VSGAGRHGRATTFDFTGHVAVVSGGSSGIGAATAELLAASGAAVALLGRDEAAARAVLERFPASAPSGTWHRCDVTREADVEAAFAAIDAAVGPPSVLVTSAGLLLTGTVEETSGTTWDDVLAANLTGTFLCAREAARIMRRERRGAIVTVSSEAGLRGIRALAAYCTTKAAVIELTRCMALDLADVGVRVNCVCPGTTRTKMVLDAVARTADPDAALARYASVRPLQRLGTAEEIAVAIAHLASDDAGYTTGAILAVDGGYTA
jgi:NAD(P)-dependent dehydrogenase (short-subunit alcohol dehydrogenase family)